MRLLVLNPSAQCHNRCAMCVMGQVYGDERLPRERLKALAQELDALPPERRFHEVLLAGGEPLLLHDLPLLLSWFSRVSRFTSGTQDDSVLAALATRPPHRLTLSWDSAEPEVHNRTRGRKGAFEEALHTLRFTQQRLPDTQLNTMTVVTRHTLPHLPGLVERLSREGVGQAALHLVMDIAARSLQHLRPAAADLETLYSQTLPQLLRRGAEQNLSLRVLPLFVELWPLLDQPLALAEALERGFTHPTTRQSWRRELGFWAGGELNRLPLKLTNGVCPLAAPAPPSQGRERSPTRRRLLWSHTSVTPDGSVFPCSQAALYHPKWARGNLLHPETHSLVELLEREETQEFLRHAGSHPPCRRCVALSNRLLRGTEERRAL